MNSTGKYTCEICCEQNYLVQHHILGRNITKANICSNLANICSNCHLKVHRGDIVIEKKVMTTSGYMLIWHKKEEQSITGVEAKPYIY